MCQKCGKKFGRLATMKKHERSCKELFYCICGAYYTTKEAAQVHIKRHGIGHALNEHADEKRNEG